MKTRLNRAVTCVLATMLLSAVVLGGRADDDPPAKDSSPHDAKATKSGDRDDGSRPQVRGHVDLAVLAANGTAERRAEEQIRAAIQTPITKKFVDAPLKEAVRILSDASGATMLLDEPALSEEGISDDEPVNREFDGATIEQALDVILEPIGLTWHIEHEVLIVTTVGVAEEKLSTRQYDVRSLKGLGARRDRVESRVGRRSFESRLQFAQFGGGGGGFGMGTGLPIRNTPPTSAYYRLIETLQHVTPGPWEEIDGTGGTISRVGDALIVRQTRRNHEPIAAIIDALTAFADGRFNSGVVQIRRPHYPFEADVKLRRALEERFDKPRVDKQDRVKVGGEDAVGVERTVGADVKYEDAPLAKVMKDLAARVNAPLLLDDAALSEEGISNDEPVNFSAKQLSLASALDLILPDIGLTWYVSEGRINVTTEIVAEEKLHTNIYSIRDLLAASSTMQVIESIQSETSGPWEEVDGTGGTIAEFDDLLLIRQTVNVHREVAAILHELRSAAGDGEKQAGDEDDAKAADADEPVLRYYPADNVFPVNSGAQLESLQEALVNFVAPDTWKNAGKGGVGVVSIVSNTLIVRQTPAVQKEIKEFLDDLAEAEALPGGSTGGGFGGGGFGGGGAGLGGGQQGGGGAGFFSVPTP